LIEEFIYPALAFIFFLTIIISILILVGLISRPLIWKNNQLKIRLFCAFWFTPYIIFILFFTGPTDLSLYPSHENSPYKLPWKAGISHFVAQGNRSFTSHRGLFFYAWDFVMPIGTEILSARDGQVFKVVDHFDGIGLNSNVIEILHDDGQRSIYAHIQLHGALVHEGEKVRQGQPIALSGLVGQTTEPHLHFAVLDSAGTASLPISFNDVTSGVPLAGHFYTSGNEPKK
jgi:murein DD-endopeptidase MepM/ murein hydrolase activator NlpD